MEYEADFDRLVTKLDPYHELLLYDFVTDEVENPDEWREAIRRQARRDKIQMVSRERGETPHGLTRVWAAKIWGPDYEKTRRLQRSGDVQSEAEERAALRGHEIRWLRQTQDESASRCARCGARMYTDASFDPPILDGEVFERDCLDR